MPMAKVEAKMAVTWRWVSKIYRGGIAGGGIQSDGIDRGGVDAGRLPAARKPSRRRRVVSMAPGRRCRRLAVAELGQMLDGERGTGGVSTVTAARTPRTRRFSITTGP